LVYPSVLRSRPVVEPWIIRVATAMMLTKKKRRSPNGPASRRKKR
jgi:hypothetical protein